MNHDFKGALEAYNNWVRDGDFMKTRTLSHPLTGAEEMLCDSGRAIQFALRIADRVQSGDNGVSGKMIIEGRKNYHKYSKEVYVDGIFKAMAVQMIKEMNDES